MRAVAGAAQAQLAPSMSIHPFCAQSSSAMTLVALLLVVLVAAGGASGAPSDPVPAICSGVTSSATVGELRQEFTGSCPNGVVCGAECEQVLHQVCPGTKC